MVFTKIKNRSLLLLAALLIGVTPLLRSDLISAAELTSRRVTISNSTQSAVNSHLFQFVIPSYTNVGSIEFEYCTNSPFPGDACVVPAGFTVAAATLAGQSGETGFTVDAPSTTSRIVLTRGPAPTSGIPVSYTFNNVTNPSTAGQSVYVRISTYATDDATGSRTDSGAVVFSTARNIAVNGYVPPYLVFCVGVTVATNCSSASGYLLDFGELLRRSTRALSSQYSGATNDPGGFATTVYGITMTSGNNIIPALATPQGSQTNTGQFGMNLRANSNPTIGAEADGPGTSAPVSQLNIPNQFYFANQVISNSPLPTDYKRFTASYIVNVGPDQRPGVYSTTLTYIATAAF